MKKIKDFIIYKTTHIESGCWYIGQDSYNRPYYLGSGKILKQAIKKYRHCGKYIYRFLGEESKKVMLKKKYDKIVNMETGDIYPSIRAVAIKYSGKKNGGGVSHAIRNNSRYYGYHWGRYVDIISE